jgi:Bacterial Ig domain/Papain family cysteine protease
MKLSRKRISIAALLLVTLLWASCKKEVSNQSFEKPQELQNIRASGVVEDDPNLVSKVPMIMSSDFLKKAINEPALLAALRGGKPDNIPPTVSITSPANTATVSGTIPITVNTSDNVGVSSVSLSVDGAAAGSSSIYPFTVSWNSSMVSNAAHTLMVTAKDAAGNTAASNSIQVTVNTVSASDNTNPTVSITSPANGASVSGTVSFAASASDNIGVISVKFSVDGTLVGSDNSSPYSFSWNTATVAAGLHTLAATATDAAGNSSSNSIQVSVNTTIIPPTPTLPSSVQLTMPAVQNQGVEGSCVTFAVAYAARSCEQYYRSNATSYSLSTNVFSPEFVFNQIQTGCSGSSLLTALDLIVSKGACTWAIMPYSDYGCTLQPNASQFTEAANYKITSYSRVSTSDITAMKTILFNKHPLMMTFANDNNFNYAGTDYIWKSYDVSGGYGAHAITICGYDDSKHAYKAINSWGTTWGTAGYIWIDYAFLPSVANYLYVMN